MSTETEKPTTSFLLKEEKKLRTIANREYKKAVTAQEKLKDDAPAKEVKAANALVNKTLKAQTTANNKVEKLEAKLAKEKEAAKGETKERGPIVKSLEITEEICKAHKVPLSCLGKATLFVHEYCAKQSDKEGYLKKTRKEVVKELLEIGLSKNTCQTQVSKYVKGDYPKNFSKADKA